MPTTTSERARSSAPTPPDAAVDHTLDAQRAFGHVLRAARERRGLTIGRIAEVTKVCPSHFQALERGDVGRWPRGLFRRAFFRGYVEMIDLPVAETLEEFIRLFPEDAASATTQAPSRQEAAETLPLVLDDSWHGSKAPVTSRLAAAVIDLGIVMLPALVVWFLGRNPVAAIAIASVSYFTLGTLFLGGSPSAWAWQRRSVLARALSLISRPAAAPAPKPVEEPVEGFRLGEERSWTTDARRVGPPRIRVRFKWS